METNRTAVPKASPFVLPQLGAFLQRFAHLFRRGSTLRTLERYVTGLLTDLHRKNCDTIADSVAGTSDEQLQHLLTDAKWDSAALDKERVHHLAEQSPDDGILIIDDTGLAKQGSHSVGVKPQYSGSLGKVGNCQVVVSAEYVVDEPTASRPLHWPVTARLYLPDTWSEDQQRRQRAQVPDDLEFKTKPEIAIDLVDHARSWGVPFKYVVADAGYGHNHSFLAALEERNISYICGVESTFGIRLPAEVQAARTAPLPPYSGKGRPVTQPKLAPLYQVKNVLDQIPEDAWHVVTWREGTKHTLSRQYAAVRVHRATGNPKFQRSVGSWRAMTGEEAWLLIEKPLTGDKGDPKYYYSNLPADTPLHRLVTLIHARWTIEQFYEDAKGECGLDDYQGRSWHGLHRHLALVMLSYSFLVQERLPATEGDAGSLFPLCSKPFAA